MRKIMASLNEALPEVYQVNEYVYACVRCVTCVCMRVSYGTCKSFVLGGRKGEQDWVGRDCLAVCRCSSVTGIVTGARAHTHTHTRLSSASETPTWLIPSCRLRGRRLLPSSAWRTWMALRGPLLLRGLQLLARQCCARQLLQTLEVEGGGGGAVRGGGGKGSSPLLGKLLPYFSCSTGYILHA